MEKSLRVFLMKRMGWLKHRSKKHQSVIGKWWGFQLDWMKKYLFLVSSFFCFNHIFSVHHPLVPFVCPRWSSKSKMTPKHKGADKGAEDNTDEWRKSIQGVQQNKRVWNWGKPASSCQNLGSALFFGFNGFSLFLFLRISCLCLERRVRRWLLVVHW